MVDAVGISVGWDRLASSAQGDYTGLQNIAVGSAATQTVPFTLLNTVVSLRSTVACWFSVGGTAAAHTAGSDYLPPNVTWMLKISQGAVLSFIQDSIAGWVSVTPAVNPQSLTLLLDAVPAAAAAYSLRKLTTTYSGACVNVRRSSDNATQDIGFIGYGDLDVPTLSTFIGGGSGFVTRWYDQSGNGNHAVQATAANQPPITTSLAAFKGRPALFGGASSNVFGLSVPASASINNPFAAVAGGSVSMVVNILAASGVGNPFFNKTNVQCHLVGTTWRFQQVAVPTGGLWNFNTPMPLAAHILTVTYSSASLANVPTFQIDSIINATTTVTVPVGAISSDAANPLIIGNLAALNAGMPAHMGEFILWNTAVPLTAVRANQKAYWGTP